MKAGPTVSQASDALFLEGFGKECKGLVDVLGVLGGGFKEADVQLFGQVLHQSLSGGLQPPLRC